MSKELDVQLDLTIPPALLRWGLIAALCSLPVQLASENVTLATYYPAPSGVYTQIMNTQQAWLAAQAGSVSIGTSSPGPAGGMTVMGGRVGIGTSSPNDVLDINVTGAIPNSIGVLMNGNCPGVKLENAGSATVYQTLGYGGCWAGGATDLALTNVTTGGSKGRVLLQSGFGAAAIDVESNSRIGINTTSPVSALDINGSVNVAGCSGGAATLAIGPDNVNCNAGSATCCPAGRYATWQPGIVTQYQYGTRQSESGDGQMFCCACPPGGCPF